MRIGLMSDVPDQTVFGGIEDPVQSYRQLDDTEPGTQMAPCDRNGVNHLSPQFIGQLRKLIFRKLTKLMRSSNAVE
jgi:hypothetical protein